MHPLYNQCTPHLNRQITVHHVDGSRYYGTLQRVTPDGLYLTPQTAMGTISSSKKTNHIVQTADRNKDQRVDAKEVFFAPFFFPFAALAGFTLGFVAGARRAYYPPYPYPPYPYPYRRYYW